MVDSSLEKKVDASKVTVLRFNGEEVSIQEVIQQCKPVLEAYYDSLQPRPTTDREKCLALQIELGESWSGHAEDQKLNLEIIFLTKKGNVYFPNQQVYP